MTNKENSRIGILNKKDVTFRNVDLEYVDTQVLEYFKKFNIQVLDESDGKIRAVPVKFSTAERWFQLRDEKTKTINAVTKKIQTPVVALKRGMITKDPDRHVMAQMGQFFYVTLGSSWSKQNQYLSKNIDRYLNKKYRPQLRYQVMVFPVFVEINYTMSIIASKMTHINKILEAFLQIEEMEVIETSTAMHKGQERGNTGSQSRRILLYFDQDFTDNSNVDNMSEDQRRFEVQTEFKIVTDLVPDLDRAFLPSVIDNFTKNITVDFSETVITP